MSDSGLNFILFQANFAWNWNMADDPNWNSSASLVETSKVELECAVKCSQLSTCASQPRASLSLQVICVSSGFITSSGQCYTGTVVPAITDFTADPAVTMSHFSRSDL